MVNLTKGSTGTVVRKEVAGPSFRLSRPLLPQEQLDLSVAEGDLSNWVREGPRNPCQHFIRSYTVGKPAYGCQTPGKFTCYKIWFNRGLG
jgi:hypothetical protein